MYFPESHPWSESSSLSKVILVLGKVRSHRVPSLGCRGAESPAWFDVLWKNYRRRDTWVGMLLWWSCRSPVTHDCGLLNLPNSFRHEMFKLNAKFDADSLLHSLSHFEYLGHILHTLTQWCLLPPLTSRVKASLFTHMHSSPLSLAARLHRCAQTILVIKEQWLGFFPDRHLAFFYVPFLIFY